MAQNGHSQKGHEEHLEHHIIPFGLLSNVMWALIGLTVLTVVTAKFIHLGPFASIVAFGIAAVKASLVLTIFMGLKYDLKENRMIFASGFFFLAILFFFCALDTYTRIFQASTL